MRSSSCHRNQPWFTAVLRKSSSALPSTRTSLSRYRFRYSRGLSRLYVAASICVFSVVIDVVRIEKELRFAVFSCTITIALLLLSFCVLEWVAGALSCEVLAEDHLRGVNRCVKSVRTLTIDTPHKLSSAVGMQCTLPS